MGKMRGLIMALIRKTEASVAVLEQLKDRGFKQRDGKGNFLGTRVEAMPSEKTGSKLK